MSRSRTKTFLLFLLVGSVLTIFPISGQDVDPARSARNIRVKKLALNWQDEVVKLTNTDGTKIKGNWWMPISTTLFWKRKMGK